jgi:hypothetical protein
MVKNLFENFLDDPLQYQKSEEYWNEVWRDVVGTTSAFDDWQTPWLGTGSPAIKDGNPIFSAISPAMRRGIRIVQQEPIDSGLDFQVWLDTFGGSPTDPESINELVIACVLSDAAIFHARMSMMTWVAGDPLSFRREPGGRLVLRGSARQPVNRWRDYADVA